MPSLRVCHLLVEIGPCRCCLCFPLEAGIVIMAGLEVALNCVLLLWFELGMAGRKTLRIGLVKGIAVLQEEYQNNCTDDSPAKPDNGCQQLEQDIQNLQNALSSVKHIPVVVYVHGYLVYIGLFVGLAGGLAGLWAVCDRRTLAAKLFMWLWLAGIAFSIAASFVRGQIEDSYGIPVAFVFIAAYFVFVIFSTKVVWSYYAVLKARDINTSSGNGSGVKLRGIMGDQRSGAIA